MKSPSIAEAIAWMQDEPDGTPQRGCEFCGRQHSLNLTAAICQRRLHSERHRGVFEDCAQPFCTLAALAIRGARSDG